MGCVVGRHNDSSLSGYHLAEIYHQRYNFKLRVPVNGFESRTFHQLRKFMWRLWAKALGEKSGSTDKEADAVALIRTTVVLIALVTNLVIVTGVIRHW